METTRIHRDKITMAALFITNDITSVVVPQRVKASELELRDEHKACWLLYTNYVELSSCFEQ